MPSTEMNDSPSLGVFQRIPGELRNEIYNMALEPNLDEEVDITHPCNAGVSRSLLAVSKQVHAETKDFIATESRRPCEHTNFVLTIPTAEAYPSHTGYDKVRWVIPRLIFDTNANKPYHGLLHAKSIRFITGHLGTNVPDSIIVRFNLPAWPEFEVCGGSAWYQKEIRYAARIVLMSLMWSREGNPDGYEKNLFTLGEWLRDSILAAIERDEIEIEKVKERRRKEYERAVRQSARLARRWWVWN